MQKRKLAKFPVLVSYAYARNNEEAFTAIANNPKVDILLDCGAYSAFNSGKVIDLGDYCDFIRRHNVRKYFMLDIIENPKASDDNLQVMLSDGLTPIPIHVYGDNKARMDYLFSISDYVALGGLIERSNPKSYVKTTMQWANHRKTHWFGYVKEEMFSLRPYSCDASTWCNGVKFGAIAVYLSNGKWMNPQSVTFDKRKLLTSNRGVKYRLRQLGFTTNDINDKEQWRNVGTGTLAQVVPADSWVRYVLDVYHHYGVKIYLVASTDFAGTTKAMLDAIDRYMGDRKNV